LLARWREQARALPSAAHLATPTLNDHIPDLIDELATISRGNSQFQRTGIAPQDFLHRLDRFLGELPTDFSYAVENRNPRLLGPDCHSLLQAHQVAHVYNHWTYMPPLAEQHKKLSEVFTAPFVLFRLLTPLRIKYEAAVQMAEPYNKIVKPLSEMRDDTVQLIRKAVAQERRAYVLVNNRAEGCAPPMISPTSDRTRRKPWVTPSGNRTATGAASAGEHTRPVIAMMTATAVQASRWLTEGFR